MTKVNEGVNFLDKIWQSNEVTFKLNRYINRHNCVYWSNNNPHVILEKDINLSGVTVWAAISCMGLTFFLPLFHKGNKFFGAV